MLILRLFTCHHYVSSQRSLLLSFSSAALSWLFPRLDRCLLRHGGRTFLQLVKEGKCILGEIEML